MKAAQRIDWLAWWQLLRVANVFTAASNVIAGFLLVQRDWQPILPLLLLVLTSVLLYEAGMVLNDVCDAKLDAVERPERPIPSGQIRRGTAYILALGFLGGGIFSSFAASWISEQFHTVTFALALVLAIVAYNMGAKSTRFGPLVMGTCRALNVLLGASVGANFATLTEHPAAGLFAAGVGIYTIGLTLFARGEAGDRQPTMLPVALLLLLGLSLVAVMPLVFREARVTPSAWIALCCGLFFLVGRLLIRHRSDSSPENVRRVVGALIQLFIPFDAAACALAVGWPAGLAVLSLLIPMRLIARWTPMT